MSVNKKEFDNFLKQEPWAMDNSELVFGRSLGRYTAINGMVHIHAGIEEHADGYYQIFNDTNGDTHLQIDIAGNKKEGIVQTSGQIVLLDENGESKVLIPKKEYFIPQAE
jgi:hypothetical protein